MNVLFSLKIFAIILAVLVLVLFFIYRKNSVENMSLGVKLKTMCVGFIANFGDTFGIGSFASIVALRRFFKLMPDEASFIGGLNIQAIITALAQALIFLHFVKVDLITLIVSCVMISLGGILSGFVAVKVSKAFIQRVMLIAFSVSGVILLLSQLGVFTMNGMGNSIAGYRLVVFAVFMFISGLLPAFGVGYYSLVQVFIFIIGASPIIAFPIMATASAFQMPATAVPFILNRKFYFKSALLLMIAGVVGVFVAAPLITHVNSYYLKWVLFVVILYNVIMLLKNYAVNKMK